MLFLKIIYIKRFREENVSKNYSTQSKIEVEASQLNRVKNFKINVLPTFIR